MSADLREALDQIMTLCNQARAYTRRTQLIHEAAMRGLGLTANQRHARHIAIFERIGDNPGKKTFISRVEKSRAKLQEKFGYDKTTNEDAPA